MNDSNKITVLYEDNHLVIVNKIAGALLIFTLLFVYVPLTLIYLPRFANGYNSILATGLFTIDSLILIGLLPFFSDRTLAFKILYYGILVIIGLGGIVNLFWLGTIKVLGEIGVLALFGVVFFWLLQMFRPRKINIFLLNILSLTTIIAFIFLFNLSKYIMLFYS